MTQPRSHSLALGLIECAEPGRVDQADACTGLDDGLHTRQVTVPRSIHERRAAGVAARIDLDSALSQECEDALRSTRGSRVQRRPSDLVGEIRGHALGEKPAHRGHVIAVGKVPNVAGAHLVLITGFSHRREKIVGEHGDRRLEKRPLGGSFVVCVSRRFLPAEVEAEDLRLGPVSAPAHLFCWLDFLPGRGSSESPARTKVQKKNGTGEICATTPWITPAGTPWRSLPTTRTRVRASACLEETVGPGTV